jgi:hypothetical protein
VHKDPIDSAMKRYNQFIKPMLKFYETWRHIVSKEVGFDKRYLENIDTKEQYQELIRRLTSSEKYGAGMAQWHERFYLSSREIFQFLLKISLTPDFSCLASLEQNGQTEVFLFPFTKLQRDIFLRTGRTITDCKEDLAKQTILEKRGAQVVTHVGLPFAPIYTDLTQNLSQTHQGARSARPAVLGIANDRLVALAILSGRSPVMDSSRKMNFMMNFTDEIPLRNQLAKSFIDRITKGVDIDALNLNQNVFQTMKKGQFATSFSTEKEYLKLLISTLKEAISIPGRDSLNQIRLAPYRILPKIEFMETGEKTTCIESDKGGQFCAAAKHAEAVRLIKNIEEVLDLRKQWYPQEKTIELFRSWIAKYFPPEGKAIELSYMSIYRISREMSEVTSGNPVLQEEFEKIFNKLFLGESVLFGHFNNVFFEEIRTKNKDAPFVETEKIKEPTRLRPMKHWISKLDPSVFDFLKEYDSFKEISKAEDYSGLDVIGAQKRLDGVLKKFDQWRKTYAADSEEWDAKADILYNALFMN